MAKTGEPAAASERYFMEAHYYDGGLRTRPLAVDKRPGWAPADDSVGFRNEFPLNAGDRVVEFCRWSRRNERGTWVGVFVPSVDSQFGNRQNHAGVGLWMRDRHLIYPSDLLDVLFQFADLVAVKGDLSVVDQNAAGFMTERYAGTCTVPAENFPLQFGGWAPLDPVKSGTAYYLAESSDPEERRELACEQLVRMGFLQSRAENIARGLILVTADGRREFPRGEPERVERNVIEPILEMIPRIAAESTAQIHQLSADLDEARATGSAAAARAEQLERSNSDLKTRITALDAQIEKSDTLTALNSVLNKLEEVANNGRAAIDRLTRIEGRLPENKKPASTGKTHVPASQPAQAYAPRHQKTYYVPEKSGRHGVTKAELAALIVLGITVLGVLGYIFYTRIMYPL